MLVVQNEWYGALFVGAVVIATMMMTTTWQKDEKWTKKLNVITKAFLISACFTYLVIYFMNNSIGNEVLENVIKGEPDF